MLLETVAAYFDNTVCEDAFDSKTQFYGQLDVYDDSRRDGVTVVRRILSVAGSVVIPARRVITVNAEQWIVGTHEADMFRGAIVRNKFVIQRADGACTIRTPAQALSTGGTASYGAKLWVKDMKELEISSKLSGFFNLFLPSYETVNLGDVLQLAGRQHIVRNTFLSAAGFRVAEVDELAADALQAGTFKPRTYTPATDAQANGTPVALTVLRLRFQDEYEYLSPAQTKLEPGDIRVFLKKGVTVAPPKMGDLLTLPDTDWLVHAISDESGCWGLHLRRTA